MDAASLLQLAVSGLTIGCVYSLVALGFSLTLRATELINFAQGELVMLGAFIGLTLLGFFHPPFWAVFLLSSAATGLIGVLLEFVVLRPILVRKAPLPNLLIATLGISVALQAVAIVVWGREPIPYPTLFSTDTVTVGGIHIGVLNLWILCLAVLVMGGLQFFFQRTLTGISWRAAALDPATAALYGVSRRRNVALTFGLSAALAGGAGVLIGPIFFASTGLGHSVLTKAFAAAAIGGFGIVGTMVGGLVLGLVETFAAGLVSSEYKNVIMYAILLGILMFFFRPKMPSGRSITETSKVVLTRALPHSLVGKILLGLLAVAWLAAPLLLDTYLTRVLVLATISAIAALGLQLIIGFTGQLSFGHAAFVGIGAYAAAIGSTKLPFVLTLPLGGLAATLAGLVVAPVLRLSGHYLAIATLALGEIVFLLINNLKSITNGAYGLYGIPAPSIGSLSFDTDGSFFVLATLVMYLVLFGMNRLIASRFGRSLVAIRENELAALSCGIDPVRSKISAFMIGTFCAGLSGALYAHYMAYISPENFSYVLSVELVTMVVIGGLGSLVGSIVGAFVVVTMPEWLRGLADYRLIVYGAVLVLFMIFLPGGVMDLVRRLGRLIVRPHFSAVGRLSEDVP